jgi:hypothetical protein
MEELNSRSSQTSTTMYTAQDVLIQRKIAHSAHTSFYLGNNVIVLFSILFWK